MATIGIVVHRERPVAHDLARETVGWLVDRGHEVRMPTEDAGLVGVAEVGYEPDEFVAGLDVLVGIGGDGTILRAVDLAADADVAVLGVNAGTLGYLASVEPGSLRIALKRFLAGSYTLSERMRLEVTVERSDGEVEDSVRVLNEVVLERSEPGHTVRVGVTIGGRFFTPYLADGLIVATPTGSTAYAFSVRGPIIAPHHRAILLAPVSPHMLFDRSLVLEPTEEVRLQVRDHRPASLSLDGRRGGVLRDGDTVICTGARRPARLVEFGAEDFHAVLREKFSLADRP
jgi:NAD+ kinase